MLFGVLSAIALGIGITATAQDLIHEEAVAQQDKPGIQIEDVRQEVEADDGGFPR